MSVIIIRGSYRLFLCEPQTTLSSSSIIPGGYVEHANIPPSVIISTAGQMLHLQDVDARR